MTCRPVYLVDQASARIARLDVRSAGDRYQGTISLEETPPQLKHLFEEFEEMVEGQMFELAEEIEEKIAMMPLKAVFEDGTEARVEELQVFPRTKRVSFKT